jgi:hypothetical protein
MISETSSKADMIGRWSEGCSCHEDDNLLRASMIRSNRFKRARTVDRRIDGRDATTCPYKGCRAPELAAGEGVTKAAKLQ